MCDIQLIVFILPVLEAFFVVRDQIFGLGKLDLAQLALEDPARVPGRVPRVVVRLDERGVVVLLAVLVELHVRPVGQQDFEHLRRDDQLVVAAPGLQAVGRLAHAARQLLGVGLEFGVALAEDAFVDVAFPDLGEPVGLLHFAGLGRERQEVRETQLEEAVLRVVGGDAFQVADPEQDVAAARAGARQLHEVVRSDAGQVLGRPHLALAFAEQQLFDLQQRRLQTFDVDMVAGVDDVRDPRQVVDQVLVHVLFGEVLDELVEGLRRGFAFFELQELRLLRQRAEVQVDLSADQLVDVDLVADEVRLDAVQVPRLFVHLGPLFLDQLHDVVAHCDLRRALLQPLLRQTVRDRLPDRVDAFEVLRAQEVAELLDLGLVDDLVPLVHFTAWLLHE